MVMILSVPDLQHVFDISKVPSMVLWNVSIHRTFFISKQFSVLQMKKHAKNEINFTDKIKIIFLSLLSPLQPSYSGKYRFAIFF